VSTSTATLDWLLRLCPSDAGIDRKNLASLLAELARSVEPELGRGIGIPAQDLRLEQLRTLLFGREIEVLSRLSKVVEDPEEFAAAIGRVLHSAIANASSDERLGQVLAPTLERAAQSSIRKDPGNLINVLYPLIVPAIRKSIGETVDETFQSLNETLKDSLTWRGLRWRWEAWRTGRSFAEVVLKHTLVYQVEHVFLIHRHSGLLIVHVAAKEATSQDPQLVSSMLAAIQDFVRDSFKGAEGHGVDTLRLGDLRLWCEAGPLAMLVAVIRGNPPEGLRETLRNVLSRIHEERRQALESFDGDTSGLADVEAHLAECATMRQQAARAPQKGFPWLVALIALLVVAFIGGEGLRWLERERQRERLRDAELRVWSSYVERLRAAPGIVVTEAGERDGKFAIAGLRDPLALDPAQALREAGVDPTEILSRWQPYQALDPAFALQRLEASLAPPPSVTLALAGDRIVAQGSASAEWIARAAAAARMLPAGGPGLDLSGVQIEAEQRLWSGYVERLRSAPGIVVAEVGERDGKFVIAGLRDPLALDPEQALREAGLDPTHVVSRWQPYQALDPPIVLQRLQASLAPPPGVTLAITGDRIVAQGSAPSVWLARARIAARTLPAGGPMLDLSEVQDVGEGAFAKLREAIQKHEFRFNSNEPLPAPGQDAALDQLASELNELVALASSMRATARIRLTGHSDDTGPGTLNLSISMARAGAVLALLRKRGVDSDLVTIRGAGPLEPLEPGATETARSQNRRVSVTVWLEVQP
jgi:outer membrane protein OmpA-like peptidoglycan-associated protein